MERSSRGSEARLGNRTRESTVHLPNREGSTHHPGSHVGHSAERFQQKDSPRFRDSVTEGARIDRPQEGMGAEQAGWWLGVIAGITVTPSNYPTHFIRMQTSDFFVGGSLRLGLVISFLVPAFRRTLLGEEETTE